MKNQLLTLILGIILSTTDNALGQSTYQHRVGVPEGSYGIPYPSTGITTSADHDTSPANNSQALILTVNFSEFTASIIEGKKARLDWETASEENTSSFIIERSKDQRFCAIR